MSEENQHEPTSGAEVSKETTEPTLRARLSTWLSKRPLSSVIVASVLALMIGIGIGGAGARLHDGHFGGPGKMHLLGGFDHDQDGPGFGPDRQQGPGMMPPFGGNNQNGGPLDQNGPGGQAGPGGGPNGQNGPGMMGNDDGSWQWVPNPSASPSATQ